MGTKEILITFIIVIAIIIVFYSFSRTKYDIIVIDGIKYHVLPFENRDKAAKLMSDINSNLMKFLRKLRDKYKIDQPGRKPTTHDEKIANAILNGYNYETVYENNPHNINDETSYTINKGDRMHLCIRNKKDPTQLVDYNTLVFVLLHEIAHIGHYNGWGHPKQFWSTFKWLLKEAVDAGFYTPVDYVKKPVVYCGLNIVYQPLYDDLL